VDPPSLTIGGSWWLCTCEANPLEISFSFLSVVVLGWFLGFLLFLGPSASCFFRCSTGHHDHPTSLMRCCSLTCLWWLLLLRVQHPGRVCSGGAAAILSASRFPCGSWDRDNYSSCFSLTIPGGLEKVCQGPGMYPRTFSVVSSISTVRVDPLAFVLGFWISIVGPGRAVFFRASLL